MYVRVCVCLCAGMSGCRSLCPAGQYRGGGYPVTASGKQYYSTGMPHMQCYSATHNECVRDCSCAVVRARVSAFFQICVFVKQVCICVGF